MSTSLCLFYSILNYYEYSLGLQISHNSLNNVLDLFSNLNIPYACAQSTERWIVGLSHWCYYFVLARVLLLFRFMVIADFLLLVLP